MVKNNPKPQLLIAHLLTSGVENCATHSSICSFARTNHSFTGSALFVSLTRSAVLIRSLARSLTLELIAKMFFATKSNSVSTHCAPPPSPPPRPRSSGSGPINGRDWRGARSSDHWFACSLTHSFVLSPPPPGRDQVALALLMGGIGGVLGAALIVLFVCLLTHCAPSP